MLSAALREKTDVQLTRLLYQQLGLALWAESLAAIGFTVAVWGALDHLFLLLWLGSNLLICGLGRHLMLHAYHLYYRTHKLEDGHLFWQWLYNLGAFLSGISWGFTCSFLMVENDFVRQTFAVFLLIGVTCAANAIYSPNRLTYILFILPAFLPFIFWLFMHGDVFMILGTLALVYMIVMLAISFYSHQLISTSLVLRFENTNLIDDLEKRQQELEKSLSVVRATLESTTDGLLVVDSQNKIEDFNKRFKEMWKITDKIMEEGDIYHFINKVRDQLADPDSFIEKIEKLSPNVQSVNYEELRFKDGRIFEIYSLPQRMGEKSIGRVWSFRDVTSRKVLEAKLFHQANFDALTNLPNRALLLDRIKQAIFYAKFAKQNLGVMFLDLDRFKLINDTLGHGFGDKLLIAVAKRLLFFAKENDTVSREGGDEFVLLISNLETESEIITIASNLLLAMREPFHIKDHKINITVSIGISFYPKDGEDPELIIRNADIAMYHAKQLGRNNMQFFTSEMNKKVLKRLTLENQLRDALDQEQFIIVYQPIVNIKTGRVVGLEALLRWQHPKQVDIETNEFISIAEETGVIIPIGEWVLRKACLHTKNLQKNGYPNLYIAVNLSGRQFKQVNFFDRIKLILHDTQLAPQSLALEFTESIIMDDAEKTIVLLNNLKAAGISLVVDDFGTGYSSLNYLKRLPVDKLKIDKSFLHDIPDRGEDAAITAAIIALANKLNLQVVAEGVEHQHQLDFLAAHSCDEIQGFYFSEALTAEDCLMMLNKNKAEPFKN